MEFIVLEAKEATTKDERKAPFFAVKVTEDTYLKQKEYERLTGRKVNYSTGGSALGYAVFEGDASYSVIKKHIEQVAAGEDPITILIGERKVEKVAPYYPINPTTNKKAVDPATGSPVVRDEVMFFCPEAASSTTILRSIVRGLEQVKIEGASNAEPDPLNP